MSKLRAAVSILFLAVASSATAARPAASGTTSPQIAYVRAGTSGSRQLMVANEDGSGAKAIYASPRMLSGELGPDGYIYFWDGGSFNRMPAAGGTRQPLFDSSGTVARHSDLSKDGRSIAWYSPNAGMLLRYDIGGQQTPLTATATVLDLTYDYTGSSIIYVEQVNDTQYEVKSVPATGGTPSSLGLVGGYANVDSAHADGTLVLTVYQQGVPYLELWKPGMSGSMRIAQGYNGTYRCDDSAILFDRMASSGAALYRRASSGAITLVAKPESIFPSYKPVC